MAHHSLVLGTLGSTSMVHLGPIVNSKINKKHRHAKHVALTIL